MTKMLGIDVSDNQGYIEWEKVKAAGVQFAIMRTTRRSGNPDKYLASNIAGCRANNIQFNFYKYSYALTKSAASEEAKRVVEVLKGYGVVPSKDTVIFMDVEDECQMALSTAALTEIIQAFKHEVLTAGFEFGLYMGKYRYENGEVDLNQLNEHTWIARYYKGYDIVQFGTEPDEAYRPSVKTGKLQGWQFSSSGRVPGIKGDVDLNVAYYDIKETKIEPEYYDTPEFTLIDSLNKIGVDSSFKHRAKIAVANHIQNYQGSVEQNLHMLQLLNEGKLIVA